MTLSSLFASLRSTLAARHEAGESLSQIARTFPACVSKAMIGRIIKDGYIPKDPEIVKALGLWEPMTKEQRAIRKMARRTADTVVRRKKSRIKYMAVTKNGK